MINDIEFEGEMARLEASHFDGLDEAEAILGSTRFVFGRHIIPARFWSDRNAFYEMAEELHLNGGRLVTDKWGELHIGSPVTELEDPYRCYDRAIRSLINCQQVPVPHIMASLCFLLSITLRLPT
ncbi:hypothetical protein [Ferrimonas marina]|uniref:Uncharacterized protein n=1 Tax=Ferrimonas marina TaxID=299255 RepID=A0A1M5UM51_9GAMM|nr:hypothetical protein [Ferrimonas marina]SHH64092.1 hypothetical protein SAMN02745129_2635 [Ferrimonas marina]